jgi:hypothetical protein
MAFSEIFSSTFLKTRRDLDVYTKLYTLDIDSDDFAPFTVSTYQMPFMAQIRAVADIKDKTRRYVPIDVGSIGLYENLDVGIIDDSISYYVTPTGLQFIDIPDDIQRVRVYMVPSFDSLDDSEEIHVPSGRDIDFFQIIEQIVTSKRPSDLKNDL